MSLVLGIDAAWTETGSSGVALLQIANGKRSMLELDALISALVGVCVLEGRAEPFGDDDCAIWVPVKLSGAKHD
jgi:hypothetical protein